MSAIIEYEYAFTYHRPVRASEHTLLHPHNNIYTEALPFMYTSLFVELAD